MHASEMLKKESGSGQVLLLARRTRTMKRCYPMRAVEGSLVRSP